MARLVLHSSLPKFISRLQQHAWVLLFCGAIPVMNAQSNVRFEAAIQAKEVVVNQTFEITFTLQNAEAQHFTPPDFTGFSKGGTLVRKKMSLKVAGFPKDMPDHIDIDVSELDFHHAIKVGDVKMKGLTFLDTKSSPIAVVEVSRAAKMIEEDDAAAAAAAGAATEEAAKAEDKD